MKRKLIALLVLIVCIAGVIIYSTVYSNRSLEAEKIAAKEHFKNRMKDSNAEKQMENALTEINDIATGFQQDAKKLLEDIDSATNSGDYDELENIAEELKNK